MSRVLKNVLRSTVFPAAFALQILSYSTAPVLAQEAVGLRAWAHNDFGRIVFDWQSAVEMNSVVQGNKLVISFSKPFDASLAPIGDQLAKYIGAGEISPDGLTLTFPLKQGINVSSFKNGQSVVVDLKPISKVADVTATSQPNNTATTAPIRVRIGQHEEFTRMVFDWATPTNYTANMDAGNLSMSFQAPASFDLNGISGQLPDGYGQLKSTQEGSNTSFSLSSPSGTTIRHFKSGNKVVVDLVKGPAGALPQTAVAPEVKQDIPEVKAAPSVPVEEGSAPEVVQPAEVETDKKPVAVPTLEATPSLSLTEEPTANELKPSGENLTEEQKAIEAAKAAELDATRIAEEEAALEKAEREQTITLLRPDQEELSARLAEKKRKEKLINNSNAPPPVSLTFQWPENVGAAAFRRGSNIWVVFDKRSPIDLTPLRQQGSPLIERIEQLPISGATVIRIKTLPNINPVAKKEGFDWVFEFRQGPVVPSIQATIQAEVDGDLGPHLAFPSAEPGALINVPDPDVGDTLRVATMKEPGVGVRGQRAYPEFQILASAQGIAIEPLADDVLFERDLDGFLLHHPDGLHISAISPEAPVSDLSQLSSKRLFNFSAWLKNGPDNYQKDLQEFITAINELPAGEKNSARMKLAHFYLAHGRGPEAKGVLGMIASHEQALETRPDFRALVGVAHFLNRDYVQARQTLNDPRLDGFTEASIWRGATLAELGDWKLAGDYFRAGDSLLLRYPYPLKGKLAMLRAEAALANRDLRSAESWLKELDKDTEDLNRSQIASLSYHLARIALTKNNLDQASDMWTELRDGDDLFNAVRSQYALVNLNLKQEIMTVKEAIDILDKLRYRWRGDNFELAVLRRLSELHFDNMDYRNGLHIMKTVVTYYPESPLGKKMAEDMVNIFVELYLDGGADRLPPLKALAIYDEFRELTPSGPDGDEMIEKLADRLIAVDLLNRAASLLDHQVRFRLQGDERARVGAKLALVHLIDGQAEDAIRALNASQSLELDEGLEADRRRLRAKAAFELGDLTEAIKLLAGDVSTEADMLRRDMFWAEENWSEVSRVLQSLAGNPPEDTEEGIDDEKSGFVLNWAVALRLNEDEEGIALLHELYGPAMQYSSLANAYNFIATPVNAERPEKLQDMIRQLANSDMFNAFVNNYREKLLNRADDRMGIPPADAQKPATTPAANG